MADYIVHYNKGDRTLKNVGYWTSKTKVYFWKKGVKPRTKDNAFRTYLLSNLIEKKDPKDGKMKKWREV